MNATRRLLMATAVGALTLAAGSVASAATPLLRLDGVGPVKLGMTRPTGVATGWLAHKALGCELASPRPVVFQFDGAKAPAGMKGSAEFNGGKLTSVSFSKGVHTRLGIRPGVSTTTAMVRAYRKAGFHVTSVFDTTFQARFVTATRGGRSIQAVASGSVIDVIAVPRVPLCE